MAKKSDSDEALARLIGYKTAGLQALVHRALGEVQQPYGAEVPPGFLLSRRNDAPPLRQLMEFRETKKNWTPQPEVTNRKKDLPDKNSIGIEDKYAFGNDGFSDLSEDENDPPLIFHKKDSYFPAFPVVDDKGRKRSLAEGQPPADERDPQEPGDMYIGVASGVAEKEPPEDEGTLDALDSSNSTSGKELDNKKLPGPFSSLNTSGLENDTIWRIPAAPDKPNSRDERESFAKGSNFPACSVVDDKGHDWSLAEGLPPAGTEVTIQNGSESLKGTVHKPGPQEPGYMYIGVPSGDPEYMSHFGDVVLSGTIVPLVKVRIA